MEYLVHHKHSLKILFKSKHFPGRYRRKREWVFFMKHSVWHTCAEYLDGIVEGNYFNDKEFVGIYRVVYGVNGLRGLRSARRTATASLALGELSSWPERDIT